MPIVRDDLALVSHLSATPIPPTKEALRRTLPNRSAITAAQMSRHSLATVMNAVAFSVTNTGMGSVTCGDALSTWILRWKSDIILANWASVWGDDRWPLDAALAVESDSRVREEVT